MKIRNTVAPVLLALIGYAQPIPAETFADKMRAFLLGPEAEANVPDARSSLDDVAQGCLECHDGSIASHVSVKSAGSPMRFGRLGSGNHPVGMRYDDHRREQPARYRARALLDPDITLVDGIVTCVSCHRLKKAGPGARHERVAALSGRGSCSASSGLTVAQNLCRACHLL
jgi:hypothetical protein